MSLWAKTLFLWELAMVLKGGGGRGRRPREGLAREACSVSQVRHDIDEFVFYQAFILVMSFKLVCSRWYQQQIYNWYQY